jgi:hypothetical protein
MPVPLPLAMKLPDADDATVRQENTGARLRVQLIPPSVVK